MLYQIFAFLLDAAAGLFGGACLLRLYMQHQYISFVQPLGRLVLALTDWLVQPLRRVIPLAGRRDPASLVGAYLIALVQFLLLWAVGGGQLAVLPVLALFGLLRLAISGLSGLLVVYAVLSWTQPPRSPLTVVLERLCEPPLRPLRRVMPQVRGVDLSPLVLLVLLQVAAIVLGHLQAAMLF